MNNKYMATAMRVHLELKEAVCVAYILSNNRSKTTHEVIANMKPSIRDSMFKNGMLAYTLDNR